MNALVSEPTAGLLTDPHVIAKAVSDYRTSQGTEDTSHLTGCDHADLTAGGIVRQTKTGEWIAEIEHGQTVGQADTSDAARIILTQAINWHRAEVLFRAGNSAGIAGLANWCPPVVTVIAGTP